MSALFFFTFSKLSVLSTFSVFHICSGKKIQYFFSDAENFTMKKNCIFFFLFSLFVFYTYADETASKTDSYIYNNIVTSITGAGTPYTEENYVVFTAKNNSRSVGIAFDFEHYSVIHPFSLRRIYNYEGEETDSWYYYILEKPKKLNSICYKLIIDGLWTIDPENPDVVYDIRNEIQLSRINLPSSEEKVTETTEEGFTRFIFKGDKGQKVRLGGTFTNWDSWIYELTEITPGNYEIKLPLPPGKYYYAFYTGLESFADPANPKKAYREDGKTVSEITVK